MSTSIPLNSLKVGEIAELAAPKVISDETHRLVEMGFTEGTKVRMVRKAPLNGPVEIKIRDYHLCLRAKEASYFSVILGDLR